MWCLQFLRNAFKVGAHHAVVTRVVQQEVGVAKLSAQYSVIKSETGGSDGKAKYFQLGAEVPVTDASKVMVSYGQTTYDQFYVADGKLKQFSLGYDYSLSKRSGVYAALTTKKLSDFGFSDETATTYAVGLRHAF